jgi:hypothetical protein
MGAAAALHSAACYAHGRFTNGVAYPINLRVVVGLSGWLPSSRYGIINNPEEREKKNKICMVMVMLIRLLKTHPESADSCSRSSGP